MQGINTVVFTGHVVGDLQVDPVKGCCNFLLVSSKGASGGREAVCRINVYEAPLVERCQAQVRKGVYVLVRGELMNRDGQYGRLVDIRAREIVPGESRAVDVDGKEGG